MKSIKVGIVGGSSLLAGILIEILAKHPYVELVYIDSEHYAGELLKKVHKYLKLLNFQERRFDKYSKEFITENLDLVFIAKSHTDAMNYVKELYNGKLRIIDLSGDFRLKNPLEYEKWYGKKHIAPELLEKAVYGLTEINREKIRDAILIANPGCYPTGIILALFPLLKNRIIKPEKIYIASYSGVSGAGRNPVPGKNLFIDAFNNVIPYKVTNHQHLPEIEQILNQFSENNVKLNFVPHIVSMEDGIFNTIFVEPEKNYKEKDILEIYKNEYKDCKFIKIEQDKLPEIKDVVNTNFVEIGFKINHQIGSLIIFSVIDNRIKGGAGQAVQNMNIMFDFEETAGLL